jgi:hypothetical protein
MIIHAYQLKKNFGDFDMSIFDVIKYPDIDIQSEEDLGQLPKEVIEKWHARLVEHACQSAETIAYQDKSGKCQELIDATRAFMRNEISIDDLIALNVANSSNTADNAASTARYAAYAGYAGYAANAVTAAYNAVRYAATAARDAAHNSSKKLYAANAARDAAMKLYKNWIMEELLAYEGEELISVV